MNYEQHGSIRTNRLNRGTRVIVNMREEATDDDGNGQTLVHVRSGKVLIDLGHQIYVRLDTDYPIDADDDDENEVSFFPYEVSLESKFHKGMTEAAV